MARLIHYKVPVYNGGYLNTYIDHNIMVGGNGNLSLHELELVKRKIVKKKSGYTESQVIICNVIQIEEDKNASRK